MMNKTNLFKWAAIILLGINLFLVGFLIWNKPPKHKGAINERIIKQLNFDTDQVKAYKALITQHKQEMHKLNKSIIDAKNKLYQFLKTDSTNPNEIDALKKEIGKAYASIETNNFNHFMNIKKLCHEDQLEDFDALTERLSRMFSGKHPKKKKGNKLLLNNNE